MKKNNLLFRFSNYFFHFSVLMILAILSACGGSDGGSTPNVTKPPVGDLSGKWQVTGLDSSTSLACNGINYAFTATIVQSGGNLTYAGDNGSSLSGTISGNTVSMSGSFPEDGGTTTVNSLTSTVAADCNQFTGNDSWSWTDGVTSCTGTSTFTGTRLTGTGCGGQNAGSLIQLTNNVNNDFSPQWNNTATKIVFISTRAGNKDIWIMDADGGNQTQLTVALDDDGHPHFNSDGSQIVFWSERTGDREVWVMNSDGSGQTQISNNNLANDGGGAWSPDNSQIVFRSFQGGNNDIWVMDSTGKNLMQLTTNPGNDGSPQFSPDGTQILFNSYQAGNSDIWIMGADGSNQVQLTSDPALDGQAHFNTGGTKIVFHSSRAGNNDIWVMNSDGSGKTQITTASSNDSKGDFNLDDSKIVFQSDRSGNFAIWVYKY